MLYFAPSKYLFCAAWKNCKFLGMGHGNIHIHAGDYIFFTDDVDTRHYGK